MRTWSPPSAPGWLTGWAEASCCHLRAHRLGVIFFLACGFSFILKDRDTLSKFMLMVTWSNNLPKLDVVKRPSTISEYGLIVAVAAAAAAKSLQSCPTLCDPMDSSPPGSPVPGILQARTLEWVAISFSSLLYHSHMCAYTMGFTNFSF